MRTKKDFDKQNAYNREKYDHINIMLPKGDKATWKAEAEARGLSVNAIIIKAVKYYIEHVPKEKADKQA